MSEASASYYNSDATQTGTTGRLATAFVGNAATSRPCTSGVVRRTGVLWQISSLRFPVSGQAETTRNKYTVRMSIAPSHIV